MRSWLVVRIFAVWTLLLTLALLGPVASASPGAVGTITKFPLPTPGSHPPGITSGPDGNLWFTEEIGNKIGKITPSGSIAEFPLPTAYGFPWGITAGPDGNVWFTEYASHKIGKITPRGEITEFT